MGLKIGLFSSLLAKYGHSDYDGKAGYPRHGGKYPKDRAGRNLFEIYEDNGNKAIFWFQSAYDNAKNGEFENEIIGHAISFAGKESGILKTVHPHGMRFWSTFGPSCLLQKKWRFYIIENSRRYTLL